MSQEEKEKVLGDDIRLKPVLFTDPVYFDGVYAKMHQL